MAQFGISRMTVNRALRELVEQGRIVRVAGVGSFVAEDKPQSTLLQIANIASEIRARGHDYRCELLAAERIAASPDVAAWLDLRAGESVFHTRLPAPGGRRAGAAGRPLRQPARGARLPRAGLRRARRPANTWCATCPSTRSSTWSMPCCPPPSRPSASRCRPTEPCLLLTRRTWTRTVPVTLVRCLHPGLALPARQPLPRRRQPQLRLSRATASISRSPQLLV